MRNEASSADQPGQTIRQAIDREKTDKRQSNKKTECNRMQTFSKFESGAVASDILVIVRGSVPKHQRHRQLKKKKKKRNVHETSTKIKRPQRLQEQQSVQIQSCLLPRKTRVVL